MINEKRVTFMKKSTVKIDGNDVKLLIRAGKLSFMVIFRLNLFPIIFLKVCKKKNNNNTTCSYNGAK